jgi:hypothetical protein
MPSYVRIAFRALSGGCPRSFAEHYTFLVQLAGGSLGLDIYVGSFTRYNAGDWELVAARVARELGATFEVVRQHNPPDAIRDAEEIRSTSWSGAAGLQRRWLPICPSPWIGTRVPTRPISSTSPAGTDITGCCSGRRTRSIRDCRVFLLAYPAHIPQLASSPRKRTGLLSGYYRPSLRDSCAELTL